MNHTIYTGPFDGGRADTPTTGYANVAAWLEGHSDYIKSKTPSGDYLASAYVDANGFLIIVETLRGDPPLGDTDFLAAHASQLSSSFVSDPPAFP